MRRNSTHSSKESGHFHLDFWVTSRTAADLCYLQVCSGGFKSIPDTWLAVIQGMRTGCSAALSSPDEAHDFKEAFVALATLIVEQVVFDVEEDVGAVVCVVGVCVSVCVCM